MQPLEAAVYGNAKPVLTRGRVAPMLLAGAGITLPQSVERSPGPRQISVASVSGNQKDSLRAAPSLSPRHEGVVSGSNPGAVLAGSNGTPGVPTGDSLAARLKGAVLGAPPPSTHSYQRSYRVASHSPPQTHRTSRATVPATPTLGLMSLRPRSPVQAAPSAQAPASGRLSLPHSASAGMQSQSQSRSVGTVQRPTSSMNRALSGSPPPSVAGRSPVASRR